MRAAAVVYTLGVLCLSATGFLCPWWFLGFIPLGAGAIWAADNLIDVGEERRGDTPAAPSR